MSCQLCRSETSPSHHSSSGHRAAAEIAAIAVDRLSKYYSAAVKDEASSLISDGQGPAQTEMENTDARRVTFCEQCNIIMPDVEQVAHSRLKTHTLALLNDQLLEELVVKYVDREQMWLMEEPCEEPRVAVDDTEATETYKCHICALEIPNVFKNYHERGVRHRANRALAIAASKRARDSLAAPRSGDKTQNRSGDKSQDRSGDKSRDRSGDKSQDRSGDNSRDGSGDKSKDMSRDTTGDGYVDKKFTGKMMRKLLKLYAGKNIDGSTESMEAAPAAETTKSRRITIKEYFTDILPFMSYVGEFYTLIVDDTDFLTVKIGRDTLNLHMNNYSGIYNSDQNGTTYMNCNLCNGYSNTTYSSVGQEDMLHVMSLGHIKNLLAPIDNVHMIRKIDETHSICALCNFCMPAHLTENHILKDGNHAAALSEAIKRGKNHQDNPKHLKIMIYRHAAKNIYSKWNFGNYKTINSGALFGNSGHHQNQFGFNNDASQQSAVFGHNVGGFGNQNSVFGVQRNAVPIGSAQNIQPFGIQNKGTAFGAQNNAASFGSSQNNTAGIGSQNTGFGTQNIWTVFGAQNNAASFGSSRNNPAGFGSQNTGFGTQNKGTVFGAQNNAASFGNAQNNQAGFGSQITVGFGTQNKGTAFGAQNNTASFGISQNNPAGFGSQSTGFGTQNKETVFGAQNNRAPFGSAQNTTGFGTQNNTASFGSSQNNPAGFGSQNTVFGAQNNRAPFGSAQNTTGFGTQNKRPTFGAQNIASSFIKIQNTTSVGAQNKPAAFGAQNLSDQAHKTDINCPPSNDSPSGHTSHDSKKSQNNIASECQTKSDNNVESVDFEVSQKKLEHKCEKESSASHTTQENILSFLSPLLSDFIHNPIQSHTSDENRDSPNETETESDRKQIRFNMSSSSSDSE